MEPHSTEPDADGLPISCRTASLTQAPTPTTTCATKTHQQMKASQQILHSSSAFQPTCQRVGSVYAPTSRRCRQRGCGPL
eukprot:5433550-Pyramimonas_sp.AAC.1